MFAMPGISSRNSSSPVAPDPDEVSASSAGSRYDVQSRAGEGIAFVVYKVRERGVRSGRTFALKALKANFARNPNFASPLINVSRALQNIDDANLAQLVEVGEEDGTPFLVSEWLPGGSLEDRLRRAPLSFEDTCALFLPLARALETLHRNRLTHGDVRPRQVLFAATGAPKLTDTGLDMAFGGAGFALADVQQDAALYLAPERGGGATTGPATPSTDLYSLGVILYRALAGRVPFDGPSPLSVAQRHRRDTPLAPSQFNAHCSPELEAIALRLIEKDPRARVASATELVRELERIAPSSAATVALPSNVQAEEDFSDDGDDGVRSNSVATRPVAVIDEPPPLEPKVARKKQRRREFWGFFLAVFWLIVACALFAGIVLGAYNSWLKEIPRTVPVPNYRNMTRPEAERMLAKRGLKLVVTAEVYDRRRPADTIIRGEPVPGRKVRVGREIFVTVSKGNEPIRMPDLTELALGRARQILARGGMKIGQINNQYHDTVPRGYLCGQYPEPGESFTRADPITLIVSRGPQPKDSTGDGEELPPPPEENPDAPALDDGQNPTQTRVEAPPETPMVSRKVAVQVAIPTSGESQEVRVDVADGEGERTVYRKLHAPGDLVDESVRVTREQGTKATVRIYVGGELLREQTV